MIDDKLLRQLILEHFQEKTSACFNYQFIEAIAEQMRKRQLFPGEYREERFLPDDELKINEIVWDLITDRILTPGSNHSNPDLPWLRITDFGKQVATGGTHYYDPDQYLQHLEVLVPGLDEVVKQYVSEGVHCFRQRLFFAAGVMFGAASEKLVLLLLLAIRNATGDESSKRELTSLLDRPRLPTIFKKIQDTVQRLEETIPYSVHQGSVTHLNSLFEMIRVQRNDSVHPATAEVSKEKVFLTIQSFPGAIEVINRLAGWFHQNQI